MEPTPEISRAEMGERLRRSSRALMILMSIGMVLTLVLPVVIGIASYWLLGHYDVASSMLRVWISISAGLIGVFLLNLLVMMPLTTIAATQSARLHAAFQGQGPDDVHARKLIHTLATQNTNDSDSSTMREHEPPSSQTDAHGDTSATSTQDS